MRYLGMLALLLVALTGATACDQHPQPSQTPSNAAATSSDRKETHPAQPTGEPQSGEGKQVPSPGK